MPWNYVRLAVAAFIVVWTVVFVAGLVFINIQVWHICIGLPLLGWVWLIAQVVKAV